MKKVSVCFVCLGNICRSPTAEGVFQHLLEQAGLSQYVEVDSAGTAGYHSGDPADRRAKQHAKRRGIDLTSRARAFEARDFERFDYVLAMDAENLRNLQTLRGRSSTGHLGLLRDFDPSAEPGSSVPDPYYGGEAGFEEVLDQCERACAGLLSHLQKTHAELLEKS